MNTRSRTNAAARRANRLLEEVQRFCERFTVPWATHAEAEKAAKAGIAALSATERFLYLGLLNRWVQAWNAWARRSGDPSRFDTFDTRERLPTVLRAVRCVLPLPYGGPIRTCDKNDLPLKEGRSTSLGPGEVEIVLSNGSRRIGLYDTEVFHSTPPTSFGPPPDFRRTPGGYCY